MEEPTAMGRTWTDAEYSACDAALVALMLPAGLRHRRGEHEHTPCDSEKSEVHPRTRDEPQPCSPFLALRHCTNRSTAAKFQGSCSLVAEYPAPNKMWEAPASTYASKSAAPCCSGVSS